MLTDATASHLTVVVEQLPPYVVLRNTSGMLSITGSYANLLSYLANSLNFTYTLCLSPDRQFGVRLDNGSWTGVIGMLQRKEADMALASLAITYERRQVVQYTSQMVQGKRFFIVGKPLSLRSFFGMVTVFESEVMCWAAFTFIAIYLFDWMASVLLPDNNKVRNQFQQFWMYVEMLFYQGSVQVPKSNSRRLLMVLWLVLVMVMMSIYSGKLVSKLTLQYPSDHIKSLDDFNRFPRVLPVLRRGDVDVEIFQNTPSPTFKEIWRRIAESPTKALKTNQELLSDDFLDAIEAGNMALGSYSAFYDEILEKRTRNDKSCRFGTTDPYFVTPGGIAFKRDFDQRFLEAINQRIQQMSDGNLFEYTYPPKMDDYKLCMLKDRILRIRPLSLQDFYGPYLFLLLGNCFAVSIFLCERYVRLRLWLKRRPYVLTSRLVTLPRTHQSRVIVRRTSRRRK